MELKCVAGVGKQAGFTRSNRTFMELKFELFSQFLLRSLF